MSEKVYELEDLPGVGSVIAEKMRTAGYFTVESVAVAPSNELADATGMGHEKAAEICQKAREFLSIKFQTAAELMERRKQISRLSTGSKAFDNLLQGGVESQAVLELIGEYGAGKTQICFSLCVNAHLLPENGGLDGGTLYVDTEGTFRPERVAQIAQSRGLDPYDVLNDIVVARAFNSDHQILIVNKAGKIIQDRSLKLVVLDSLINHFRSEYLGRENLAVRQQKLNNHLHKLLRLAEICNIPVVITNHVMTTPDVSFGQPDRPAGGHILAHFSTNRLYLRKGRRGVRIVKVIDSPYLPDSECVIAITERGIEDVTESE